MADPHDEATTLQAVSSRLEALINEHLQLTFRVDAGLRGVHARFSALDHGLALAHTQQEFQSVAATALAVSAADLQRGDRAKTLNELEAKGKALMLQLEQLRERRAEEAPPDDDGSYSDMAPSDMSGRSSAPHSPTIPGRFEEIECRLHLLESGSAPPGAGAARRGDTGSPPPVAPEEGGTGGAEAGTLQRSLDDLETSTQVQAGSLQASVERRLDALQTELRGLVAREGGGGTARRRQEFEMFMDELRKELGSAREAAGSEHALSSSSSAEVQQLSSRVIMHKIEQSARLSMVENSLQQAQLSALQPRLKKAERNIDDIFVKLGQRARSPRGHRKGTKEPPKASKREGSVGSEERGFI